MGEQVIDASGNQQSEISAAKALQKMDALIMIVDHILELKFNRIRRRGLETCRMVYGIQSSIFPRV